jgi:membrane protease YdiL (CAAX protease family)
MAGAMLAVAFTILTISAAIAADGPNEVVAPTTRQVMTSLVASIVMQMFGPGLLVFIAAISQATARDIGLPPLRLSAIAKDVFIGVMVCLAALLPVRLVQIALVFAFKLPQELTKHPLVQMLTSGEPDMWVLILATVVVVIVAPVGEEITFRLLLQGWLEKWEDRRLGWRIAAVTERPNDEIDLAPTVAAPVVDDESIAPIELVPVDTAPVVKEPPKRGLAGLPYGWMPIILSSLLFAAAHFGYGPEPVPLFIFALFLGYCYQRTHRIIPCIVAHGLFNLTSMIVLWRVVLLSQP